MNGLRLSEVDDVTTERGHRLLLITRMGGRRQVCGGLLGPPKRWMPVWVSE
jgi:hypothetical protein